MAYLIDTNLLACLENTSMTGWRDAAGDDGSCCYLKMIPTVLLS
jgi:hypothetical protein